MAELTDNLKGMVREWYRLKEEVKEKTAQERELRKSVLDAVFGEVSKGTKKADLGNNMELVLSVGTKIDIDKDAFIRHKTVLEKKGLIGEESVIKIEPKVSATAYKYLSEEDKVMFSDVFKHGFNSPQLDVKSKKD